jgi:signal transduction histidine kinase
MDEARGLMQQVLSGQSLVGIEVTRMRKGGSLVDLSLSAGPLYDAGGQISGIVALMLDITERNRLREQLLYSQKMEAIGRLAGGIAHDFNNILAIICGYSESLSRQLRHSDSLWAHVDEIQRAADRGAALTRQLLAFGRRQTIKTELLKLNRIVTGVHGMLQRVIPREISLTVDLADDLLRIEADPSQMEQVVMNLALNARDAMPEGGSLVIQTANVTLQPDDAALCALEPGDYARLSVMDTGHGIDSSTQSRIFEPFFTTKAGKGTGLGLSIVHAIIQQCGGSITVQSQRGKGARFDVYLPPPRQNAQGSSRAGRSPAVLR